MHVKLRMNLRRPRRKPKYSLATDSEQVPRGKGEKNRCERSEIVPEMMCLQGVEAGPSLLAAEKALQRERVERMKRRARWPALTIQRFNGLTSSHQRWLGDRVPFA
jgi:hypothetical protein